MIVMMMILKMYPKKKVRFFILFFYLFISLSFDIFLLFFIFLYNFLFLLELILAQMIALEKEKPIKICENSSTSSERHNSASQCRALLPSGKLCPRRDKLKCPFHGKIIPRCDEGLPIDSDLRKKELETRFLQKCDNWKDPKYLKQLSIQTGYDLEGKTLKNKRKKYPNLIDIKQLENTPRKRIMRKICSTKVREKVANDLNRLDEQTHQRFSDQWAYALEN